MSSFVYRKHIKKMSLLYPVIIVIGIAILVAYTQFEQFLMLVFGFILVIEGVFGLVFFKRLYTTEISIDDKGIYFKNNKKDFFIAFEEISKVETASIRGVGGYFTIIKNQEQKIRITVTLENIGTFVKRLRDELDARGLEHLYRKDKLLKFYVTAEYSDGSWRRIYHVFPKAIFYFIGFNVYIGVFVILGITQKSYASIFGMLAVTFVLIIGTIVYVVDEMVNYSRKIRRETNPETWERIQFNQEQEKKNINLIYDISFGSMTVFFILFTILSLI